MNEESLLTKVARKVYVRARAMLRRLRRWSRATTDRYFHHRLEFMASTSLILSGLWLVILKDALSYTFLSTLAPLWLWGWVLVTIGFASRLGIYKSSRRLRQMAMLAVFFARVFLLLAVAYGTAWRSNTIPEHLAWIITSTWAYLRIDAGEK